MHESQILEEARKNFARNSQPRCACLLLLDTSASMEGAPINALNRGLQTFKEELMKDNLASKRTQVAIVTFDSEVKVVHDFVDADQFNPPTLTAPGFATNMASAIQKALDMIQARKTVYKSCGIQYYRPWIFLITDGQPTEDSEIVERAAQRVKDAEVNKQVVFYAVGVEGANMTRLAQIVSDPLPLEGLNFEALFQWLSASMGAVSQSNPREPVQIPLPSKWIRLE